MTLGDHAPDDGRVWRRHINRTFVQIVACHEECRFESVRFQDIQQSRGILIWSVVVCKRHYPGLAAVVDIVVITDLADQRPGVIQRRRTRRRLV